MTPGFDRATYYRDHPIEAKLRNRLFFKVFRYHAQEVVDERLRVYDEQRAEGRRELQKLLKELGG